MPGCGPQRADADLGFRDERAGRRPGAGAVRRPADDGRPDRGHDEHRGAPAGSPGSWTSAACAPSPPARRTTPWSASTLTGRRLLGLGASPTPTLLTTGGDLVAAGRSTRSGWAWTADRSQPGRRRSSRPPPGRARPPRRPTSRRPAAARLAGRSPGHRPRRLPGRLPARGRVPRRRTARPGWTSPACPGRRAVRPTALAQAWQVGQPLPSVADVSWADRTTLVVLGGKPGQLQPYQVEVGGVVAALPKLNGAVGVWAGVRRLLGLRGHLGRAGGGAQRQRLAHPRPGDGDHHPHVRELADLVLAVTCAGCGAGRHALVPGLRREPVGRPGAAALSAATCRSGPRPPTTVSLREALNAWKDHGRADLDAVLARAACPLALEPVADPGAAGPPWSRCRRPRRLAGARGRQPVRDLALAVRPRRIGAPGAAPRAAADRPGGAGRSRPGAQPGRGHAGAGRAGAARLRGGPVLARRRRGDQRRDPAGGAPAPWRAAGAQVVGRGLRRGHGPAADLNDLLRPAAASALAYGRR